MYVYTIDKTHYHTDELYIEILNKRRLQPNKIIHLHVRSCCAQAQYYNTSILVWKYSDDGLEHVFSCCCHSVIQCNMIIMMPESKWVKKQDILSLRLLVNAVTCDQTTNNTRHRTYTYRGDLTILKANLHRSMKETSIQGTNESWIFTPWVSSEAFFSSSNFFSSAGLLPSLDSSSGAAGDPFSFTSPVSSSNLTLSGSCGLIASSSAPPSSPNTSSSPSVSPLGWFLRADEVLEYRRLFSGKAGPHSTVGNTRRSRISRRVSPFVNRPLKF